MNKLNTTGYKQVLAEISKARNVFTELDDFFRKADENISNDPDDPREGIGRFPGLDRLMSLIPCVINLEKGMKQMMEEREQRDKMMEKRFISRNIKKHIEKILTENL